MKFSSGLFLVLPWVWSICTADSGSFTYDRLDKNNTVLLVVDHQVGLFQLARDFAPDQFRQNMIAHAALGKLFNLPTILTTSAETGPNGPLPKEITEMFPNAPYIKRQGEVDAWDNAEFQAAVKATGKKQVVLGGIVTEVCTAFLALSLRQAGYEVWANTDASGTLTPELAADANRRMENAGVHLIGMFGIAMDLMRDWRNTPGAAEVFPFLNKYLSAYAYVAAAHVGATNNGTLLPGETETVK